MTTEERRVYETLSRNAGQTEAGGGGWGEYVSKCVFSPEFMSGIKKCL